MSILSVFLTQFIHKNNIHSEQTFTAYTEIFTTHEFYDNPYVLQTTFHRKSR